VLSFLAARAGLKLRPEIISSTHGSKIQRKCALFSMSFGLGLVQLSCVPCFGLQHFPIPHPSYHPMENGFNGPQRTFLRIRSEHAPS
jgi:hypothetical protein